MARQKRIALVNDITGFGRCSVTVQLPLISAMRVQACPLPTAILSVHTGFPNHYIDDYTERMRPYMENWAANALDFDAILTGFLGSERQIEVVLECIARFKGRDTCVIVDPVMGDNGRLYSSYTPELCAKMRQLLPYADVVTPNLTEACQLLGTDYPANGLVAEEELVEMAAAIAAMGPHDVIITGLHAGDRVRTYLYAEGHGYAFDNAKIGRDRSGSGDAFAAIVAAALVRGIPIEEGARRAAAFIGHCLAYAEELDLPWNYGLPFEEFMSELTTL
ncbi:pyridoxamine kinase [uncultured Selenomonas sp.]|uniref:pyridoxamine kinase n=1 Tax=uncultured Selenomonas sp. TaxID=159275 RepID=UPI0028E82E0E|nr:pyridoxamine kinase [uncultured Selenomonas sp.]